MAAATKACGDVVERSVALPVRARGISCPGARHVARYALTHHIGNAPKGPRGWQCARGSAVDSTYFLCTRGRNGVRVMDHCGNVHEAGGHAFKVVAEGMSCQGARQHVGRYLAAGCFGSGDAACPGEGFTCSVEYPDAPSPVSCELGALRFAFIYDTMP